MNEEQPKKKKKSTSPTARSGAQRIRPFSNGSQYMDWEASNCERCKKRATEEQIRKAEVPCQIEEALGLAMIGDGKISKEIWDRMDHDKGRYVWQCGEVEWTEEWKREVLLNKL